MPAAEAELYKRCDEVLHYIWDPIGVAGVPEARDEYDSYLPQVFSQLKTCVSPELIIRHLVEIEQHSMGLSARPERAREAVEALIRWRQCILDRA